MADIFDRMFAPAPGFEPPQMRPAAGDRGDRFALDLRARLKLPENDAGNAARLLAAHAEDMIFVVGRGWGVWDGTRFAFGEGELLAKGMAYELEALFRADADEARAAPVDDVTAQARLAKEREKPRPAFTDIEAARAAVTGERWARLMQRATKCGNDAKVRSALSAAEPKARVSVDALDADPWVFSCANGQIDLRPAAYDPLPEAVDPELEPDAIPSVRAGWLKPHRRDSYPTKASPVVFDPAATAPFWEETVALIMPDPDMRACLQRACGALMFGRNEAQCALMFKGGGGNGKSTVMLAINIVLGDYVMPAKIELFLDTGNASAGQATPEEADIPGARAILTSEPEPTDTLSIKRLKSFTGGDRRPARPLHKPQFYYTPRAMPVVSFNRTPRIRGEDDGTWRRLVFFPFTVNLREDLPPEKRLSETDVEARLRAEAAGILNWCLDGWREYRALADAGIGDPPGINPPAGMVSMKAQMREAADPVGEFLRDCTAPPPPGDRPEIKQAALFPVYEQWCSQIASVEPYKKGGFTRIAEEKGLRKGKADGGQRYWLGIAWQRTAMVDSLRTAAGFDA